MIEKTCQACHQPFQCEEHRFTKFIRHCPKCGDELELKSKEDEKRQAQEKRFRAFQKLCPPAFRAIDKNRLPMPEKLDSVMKWVHGPTGLLLHGGTGLGKSRCAWALMEREYMDGKSIASADALAGLEYASLYAESASVVYEWVEDMINADVLLLDDVFKVRLTDSFEGVIFAVIDRRVQWLRPTIITCNDSGRTLAERMSDDRGEPMVRRMKENCTSIHF